MKDADSSSIRIMWPKWKEKIENINKILLHSPCDFEIKYLNELFPNSSITKCSRGDWDFDDEGTLGNFDLIITSGIFMYSTQPKIWLNNILNRCKYLWAEDIVRCYRGGNQEYGDDCCRTQYSSKGVLARKIVSDKGDIVKPECIFELDEVNDKIIDFYVYDTFEYEASWLRQNECSSLIFYKGNL